MKAKDVILFVFDEEKHFNENLEFLGRDSFNDIIRIDSLSSLEKEFNSIDDNTYIHLAVHVFYTEKIKGIQIYMASGIRDKYPLIGEFFISEGSEKAIQKDMIDFEITANKPIKYHQVRSSIEDESVVVYSKKEVVENLKNSGIVKEFELKISNDIEYVIITALEEDEMEKLLPLIVKEGRVDNDKHLIEYGYFKAKPEKKIAYASQLSTGMVDASILATEMLVRFNPKFLIMAGVMGGKPEDTNIGDIIVSTKVFTIDKGKITEDDEFRRELETSNTDNAYVTSFKRDSNKIKKFIEDANVTRKDKISIHFEPIACVRQVIDKGGYFAENITTVDRKSIGLEMESYGIARACELVNNGKTIPLIIKSVMDNTSGKTDNAKTYAAWTSAMFVSYIIENDLI